MFAEKSELARSLTNHHSSLDSSGRSPIQIYGTMNPIGGGLHPNGNGYGSGGRQALLLGSPNTGRRPESINTNRSDLMLGVDPPPFCADDSQSVRTMIEVNPSGYMLHPNHYAHDGSNGVGNEYYDAHCLADYDSGGVNEVYSPIHKGRVLGGGQLGSGYAAVPYPEPPLHDEKYPSLDQCPSPHLQRHMHNGGMGAYGPVDLGYGPIGGSDVSSSYNNGYGSSPQHYQNNYQPYPLYSGSQANTLTRHQQQPQQPIHGVSGYDSLQRRRSSNQSQPGGGGQQSMSTFVSNGLNGHADMVNTAALNGYHDDSVLVEGDLV